MCRNQVISILPYLPEPVQPEPERAQAFRTRRRCMRLLAAVEAVVTGCIGAGFLFCIALAVSML